MTSRRRIALVSLLPLLLAAAPSLAATGGEPPRREIHVQGRGVAAGAPDEATVRLGVESRNTDAARAVRENSEKVAAIRARLAGAGVEAKDVQTAQLSVTPQQPFDPQTGRPSGAPSYVVDHVLSVRVRSVEKLGDVLGGSVAAGANQIQSVAFAVSDPSQLEADARAKAMAEARSRAEQLAQAGGVKLGPPLTISESAMQPMPRGDVAYRMAAEAAAAPVPVAAGELQVEIHVHVTYGIQ
jgi:uncharacterized protein YggE